MLRAYKTPIFAKGQKLTHSPAHEEKHAGQETPLLYTPYLQWHHPGGRALLQLAQAPTQDYHSYTHTLLGVVEDHVVGPNDPPVKKTREHSAAKQLWPNMDATTPFPARAWRAGVLLLRAQRVCRWSRTALATPGCGAVSCLCDQRPCLAGQEIKMGRCCTNHRTCPPVKQRPMKDCLRLRNQATLHVLYASQCDL